MPKVKFATDIQSISGKLCSKEGVIYSVNKQTGETYRSDRHVTNNPNSEAQQSVRSNFKRRSQFASAWWKQNRPSDGKTGTAAYAAVMKAYRAQHKIGNPYSFMRSLVSDDLKVVLHGEDITGGVKPGGSTASGGTSASGGSKAQGGSPSKGDNGSQGGNTDMDGSNEG